MSERKNFLVDPVGIVQAGTKSKSKKPKRHHQIRGGKRVAAVRAFTAARLVERGATKAQAAEGCGVNHVYVAAAVSILQAGDDEMEMDVTRGDLSLLKAAARAKRIVDLRVAYELAKDDERIAAFREVGIERIFDDLVHASNN